MAITAEELQVLLTAKDKLSGPMQQAAAKTGALQKALGGLTAPARSAMGALSKVGTIAAGMLSAQVIGKMTGALTGLFTGAIAAGGNAEEMLSKFGFTFGAATERATKDLEAFAASTGRSKYMLMGMSTDMGAVLKAMGLTEGATADLANSMVKLSVDVGSFNNLQASDVQDRFTRALTGEYESLKAVGIVINEAKVEQELLNLGIEGGKKAATDAQLVQARYNLILRATKDAQGDAARTSDSWANQMVALEGTWTDFQADLGRGLTGSLKPALGVFVSLARTALPAVQATLLRAAEGLGKFVEKAISLKGTVGGAEEGFAGLAGGLQKLFGLSDETTSKLDRMAEGVGLFVFSLQEGTSPIHKFVAAAKGIGTSLKQGELGPAAGDLAAMLGVDEGTANRIGQTVDGIQGRITDAVRGLTAGFQRGGAGGGATAIAKMLGLDEKNASAVGEAVGGMVEGVQGAFQALQKGDLAGAGKGLLGAFGDFGELKRTLQSNLADMLSGAFEGLGERFPSLQPYIDTFIQPILGIADTVWEALSGAQGTMGEAVGGIAKALGGLDFGGILETVRTTFGGLVSIVQNVLSDVLPVIMPILQNMVQFVTKQFGVIVDWVNENLPLIQATIETVLGAVQAIWDTVWPMLVPVIEGAWELIKSIVSTGIQNVLGILKAVMLAIQGDWEGAWEQVKGIFVRTWDMIKGIVQTAFETLKDVIAASKTGLLGAAGEWLQGLEDKVNEKMVDVIEFIIKAITGVPVQITGKVVDMKSAGMALIQGLIDGVKQKIADVKAAVTGVAEDILDTAKGALGIASPSTKFAEIALQMMAGLSQGIDAGKAKVMKDITKMIGEFIGAFGRLMEIGWESERRGPVDVTAMLDQWEQIILEAMRRIQRITDTIGYDKIHKLKLTAGRLTEILNAALVDFSQMATAKVPDVAGYFEQWEAVFLGAMVLLLRIRENHSADLLSVVAETAGKVMQVFQILGVDLAQAVPTSRRNWQAEMLLYIDQVVYLAEQMALKLLGLEDVTIGGLSEARSLAERFGAILQAMGPDLARIAPRTDAGWMQAFSDYVAQVRDLAGRIYNWLIEIDEDTAAEVERVAKIAPNIQTLLGLLGAELGGDEFTWTADWMEKARYFIQRLRFWAGLVYNWLNEIGDDTALLVARVAEIAPNVRALLELLTSEMGGDNFRWYARWMDDARYFVQRLRFWAGLVYQWLNEIDDDTARQVERAAGIAGNVQTLLELLGANFETKAPTGTFKVDLTAFSAALRLAYETLKIEVDRVLADVGEEGLGILAESSEKLQSVLGILNLGKVIEEMQVQKKLEPGQRRTAWSNVLVKFMDDLKVASQYLKDNLPGITAIWGDSWDDMTTLVKSIEGFMGSLANAIKATQEISESKFDAKTVISRISGLSQVLVAAKAETYGARPLVPKVGTDLLGQAMGRGAGRSAGYEGAGLDATALGTQIGTAVAAVLQTALGNTSLAVTIRVESDGGKQALGTRMGIAKRTSVAISQGMTAP